MKKTFYTSTNEITLMIVIFLEFQQVYERSAYFEKSNRTYECSEKV